MKRFTQVLVLMLSGVAHAATNYFPAPHVIWDGTDGGFQTTFQPTMLSAALISASGSGTDWAPMTGTGGAPTQPNSYSGLLVCSANCSNPYGQTWVPWTGSSSSASSQQSPSGRVVYNKGYYTSVTTDWNVVGQTPSLSSAGNIIINPGTLGSVTAQQIQLTNNCFNQTVSANCASPDDQTDMEVDFTVNSLTGNGLAMGRYGNNTTLTDSTGWNINFSAGPSGGGPYLSVNTLKNNVNTPINIAVLQYTPAVGDRFHAVISQRNNLYFGFVEDMTQKKITTVAFQTPVGPTGGVNDQVNTSKPLIAGFGGSYTITNFRMISRQPMNPDLCIIGDSKTSWYNASSPSMRFASNLTALGSVAVFGGAGDGISELQGAVPYIKNFGCKQILLAEPGRNSVCTGISSATWQAQYAAVVAAFTVPVFHTGIIPETNCSTPNQTTYNTYITSTYPSANYVDVITGYSTSTMMTTDNIHPNDPGHAFLAYAITHSVIPTVANPVINVPNNPFDVTRGGTPVFGDQRNVFTDAQTAPQYVTSGAAPTIANGAGAGTTPGTATVTGTNMAGVINLTTGTATVANAVLATITFNGTVTSPPQSCILQPRNSGGSSNYTVIFTTIPTTTGWTITTGTTAPAVSTAMSFGYSCI